MPNPRFIKKPKRQLTEAELDQIVTHLDEAWNQISTAMKLALNGYPKSKQPVSWMIQMLPNGAKLRKIQQMFVDEKSRRFTNPPEPVRHVPLMPVSPEPEYPWL